MSLPYGLAWGPCRREGGGWGALPDVVGVCYYCSHFQLGSHAETSPFYY